MVFDERARPNVLPWPPIIMLVSSLLSLLLGRVHPLAISQTYAAVILGWATILLGVAIDFWAILTMRRAKTNILPHKAADVLVTWGPFGLSRNPIYVANTILLVGSAVAFNNYWFGVFALIGALFVDRLAVRREERHLAAHFGEAWSDYSSKTPRWMFHQF